LIKFAEQLALVQSLIAEWLTIRLLMGELSPAAEEELTLCARSLQEASSSEQVQRATDDLLEVMLDTPAYTFVSRLIGRSSFLSQDAGTRSMQPSPSFPFVEVVTDNTEFQHEIARAGIDLACQVPKRGVPVDVPILFCTNRMAGDRGFGGEPSPELNFGLAVVTIPVLHRVATLESPRWWSLFPRYKGSDRFVQLARVESFSQDQFYTEIAHAIECSRAAELLVFLHGFNVTFEQAARRAGQIAYDLAFGGVVVLFSWPSLGVGTRRRFRVLSGSVPQESGRRTVVESASHGAQHGQSSDVGRFGGGPRCKVDLW
jgi:hypothetical protein